MTEGTVSDPQSTSDPDWFLLVGTVSAGVLLCTSSPTAHVHVSPPPLGRQNEIHRSAGPGRVPSSAQRRADAAKTMSVTESLPHGAHCRGWRREEEEADKVRRAAQGRGTGWPWEPLSRAGRFQITLGNHSDSQSREGAGAAAVLARPSSAAGSGGELRNTFRHAHVSLGEDVPAVTSWP